MIREKVLGNWAIALVTSATHIQKFKKLFSGLSSLQVKVWLEYLLMSGSNLCIHRNETARPRCLQNRIVIICLPISTFMYLWAIYSMYSQDRSAYFAAAKLAERSWENINQLTIHKSDFRCSVRQSKNLNENWMLTMKSPHPRPHGLLCDGGVGVPDLLPELRPPLLQDDPAGPQLGTHEGRRQGKEGDQK